jgi:hypothetical protein
MKQKCDENLDKMSNLKISQIEKFQILKFKRMILTESWEWFLNFYPFWKIEQESNQFE